MGDRRKSLENIIHSLLKDSGFLVHYDRRVLKFHGKKYNIRPDCCYVFQDRVIVFEYERSKRPVESISKYWWLFERTDWLSNNIPLYCVVFLGGGALKNDIRVESVVILGEELERKYPEMFRFFWFREDEVCESELKDFLAGLLK